MGDNKRIVERVAAAVVRVAFLMLALLFGFLGLTFLPVIGMLLAPPMLCLSMCFVGSEGSGMLTCEQPAVRKDRARRIGTVRSMLGEVA
jgi:hypothetical protein